MEGVILSIDDLMSIVIESLSQLFPRARCCVFPWHKSFADCGALVCVCVCVYVCVSHAGVFST